MHKSLNGSKWILCNPLPDSDEDSCELMVRLEKEQEVTSPCRQLDEELLDLCDMTHMAQ